MDATPRRALEPNRIYYEASRVAHELQKIGPRLVNPRKQNDVAIFHSIDSYHGIRSMPFAACEVSLLHRSNAKDHFKRLDFRGIPSVCSFYSMKQS